MGKVKVMITNNQTEVKIPVGIRLSVITSAGFL